MSQDARLLADLISLSTHAPIRQPLHEQIYKSIRTAILEGLLTAGTRLPASRSLCQQLKVSRNTVSSAYDQLIAEGYLLTRQGAGTYVSALPARENASAAMSTAPVDQPPAQVATFLRPLQPPGESLFRLGGKNLLPGLADWNSFPHKAWSRLFKTCASNTNELLPKLNVEHGFEPLCEALTAHLAMTRGITAKPQQIFITAGTAQSLNLISKVLTDVGDTVWMEEPGYFIAAQVLTISGLQLSPIGLDQHGIAPTPVQISAEDPRLIYCTTSYQFPLGVTMPVTRRLELLDVARAKQAWIIEDDYDGEFRYRGNPIPALFGLDNNQHTLYLGTFSKTLSWDLRLSFVLVPECLIPYFEIVYPRLGNLNSLLTQATLAEFMTRGLFARHIEQMRKLYGARKKALEQALTNAFDIPPSTLDCNPGGLHISTLLEGVQDTALEADLLAAKLGCLPLSLTYQRASEQQSGLLLGFTATDEAQITRSIADLKPILHRHKAVLTPVTNEVFSCNDAFASELC